MQLHELKSPAGARKTKRIVGRGKGSGRGKTSGRGENGQRSRSGRWTVKASEGGQMPLIRRLPKVGFRSHRPVLNQVVNVSDLAKCKEGTINAESLKAAGLINSTLKPFKILGVGDVKKSFVIQGGSISKTAREKIEKAGGKVEIEEKKVLTKKPKLSEKKVDTSKDQPAKE